MLNFFPMSLFTIDISDLLASPVGSTEEFHFEQKIPKNMWKTLACTKPLAMRIKLIREEYGIHCLLLDLKTQIDIPEEWIEDAIIELHDISREFHLKKSPKDTDDIEYIDISHGTIDFKKVIEQELLIAGL